MNRNDNVQLLFGGDFAPCGAYEDVISAKGGKIFGSAREIIERADFTMFNLEVPLCSVGVEISKVGPAIRAAPETLLALSDAHVNAVSLANNHIFDYGKDGLASTIAALETSGIRHAGANFDRPSAEAPLRVEIRGRRVSIYSFAEREFNISNDGEAGAALLDPLRMAPLILKERIHADAIIVCVHGGNEYFPYPRPGLRAICRFLVDLGADAVIGHHPHVPGPYEIYQGKPIVYSLGNLIFDTQSPSPQWDQGYMAGLELKFEDRALTGVQITLFPYYQAVIHGGLQLMQGDERDAFLERIEVMRDTLENRHAEWLNIWQEFVSQRKLQRIIDLSSPFRFRGLRRLMSLRILRNFIAPPSRQLLRLNLIRCASHRELLINAMEQQVAMQNSPKQMESED